jgi:quercetin dioxygenase-like cupin family protein/iron-sulfur cluster repair protein YtfE (RIC family)
MRQSSFSISGKLMSRDVLSRKAERVHFEMRTFVEVVTVKKVSLAFQDQNVKSVLQHGNGKFVQLSLNPGEGLTKHRTPHHLAVIVLTGSVRFSVDGETQELSASEMITVEPKVEHAVEAVQQSTVLLVLVPQQEAPTKSSGGYAVDHDNAYQNPALLDAIVPELRVLVDDHVSLCKVLSRHTENHPEDIPLLLKAVGRELDTHFLAEEEVVFPRIALHTGGHDVGPVPRLLDEHHRIRNLHREATQIHSLVESQADPHAEELLKEKIIELSTELLNHLGKEDSHLFPMAGRLLTEDEKKAVALELERYEKLV